jgi:hypothetical protein
MHCIRHVLLQVLPIRTKESTSPLHRIFFLHVLVPIIIALPFHVFEDTITEAYVVCMLHLSDITSMFRIITPFSMLPTLRIFIIIFHFRNRKQLALA